MSSSQGQLVAHNRMKCWRGELSSASSIYKFSNGSCQRDSECVSGTVSLSAGQWVCQRDSEFVSGTVSLSAGLWVCQRDCELVSGTVSLGEPGGAELASRHVICGSSLMLVFVLTQRIFLRALLLPQNQHSESIWIIYVMTLIKNVSRFSGKSSRLARSLTHW